MHPRPNLPPSARFDPVTGHLFVHEPETGVLFPRSWIDVVTGRRVTAGAAAHFLLLPEGVTAARARGIRASSAPAHGVDITNVQSAAAA